MKRLTVLLLALCLMLTACRNPAEAVPAFTQADPSATPVEESQPLKLERLNVEFVVNGRDPDRLLALRSDFPWALSDALEKQNVTVEKVTVTFGTSGEATEEAVRSGAVQVAFLSAEDYFPYRSGQIVAAEQAEPDLSLGLIVSAVSDDADADDRFAESLRLALGDLATALAPYTGEAAQGIYAYDAAQIEQLSALYEAEVEHTH